jgi:hypothetical protein
MGSLQDVWHSAAGDGAAARIGMKKCSAERRLAAAYANCPQGPASGILDAVRIESLVVGLIDT